MKMRKLLTIALSLLITISIILSAIYLPEYFLRRYALLDNNKLATPPADTYQTNNLTLSAMASMQLTGYEKMRLISHAWEGSSESVGAEYSDEDAHSMVELAKKNLKEYYRIGLYPSDFTSEDGASWYNWEAKRYCSKDSTFHRFSAYFWIIDLLKYDGSERHWIMIMEDGTILAAACEILNPDKGVVRIERRYSKLPIIRGRSCTYTAITPDMNRTSEIPYYDEITFDIPPEPTSAGKLSINLKQGTEDYYLVQHIDTLYGVLSYGLQIIPSE